MQAACFNEWEPTVNGYVLLNFFLAFEVACSHLYFCLLCSLVTTEGEECSQGMSPIVRVEVEFKKSNERPAIEAASERELMQRNILERSDLKDTERTKEQQAPEVTTTPTTAATSTTSTACTTDESVPISEEGPMDPSSYTSFDDYESTSFSNGMSFTR